MFRNIFNLSKFMVSQGNNNNLSHLQQLLYSVFPINFTLSWLLGRMRQLLMVSKLK